MKNPFRPVSKLFGNYARWCAGGRQQHRLDHLKNSYYGKIALEERAEDIEITLEVLCDSLSFMASPLRGIRDTLDVAEYFDPKLSLGDKIKFTASEIVPEMFKTALCYPLAAMTALRCAPLLGFCCAENLCYDISVGCRKIMQKSKQPSAELK